MYKTFSFKEKIKLFINILWPILITQIGLQLMSVIDTVMSGRVSEEDLAGVAIGSNLWVPIFMLMTGILLAITPIVSQLLGAEKKQTISKMVIQGVYLSITIIPIIFLVGLFALDPILRLMDLQQNVSYIAKHYLIGLSLGILPLFVAMVFRNFYNALGLTKLTMYITLAAIPFNIFFNYVLIFGKFGFPSLGGVGAGYATAVSYWFVLAISLYSVKRIQVFKEYKLFKSLVKPSLSSWKEILKVGIPIGLTIFFEASIFSVVTLFMAQFNTVTIAAHQAAINFVSLVFMIPLSVSMTLTIVIGFEAGGKRLRDATQYIKIGSFISFSVFLLSSSSMFFFREEIAKVYSNNPDVIQLTQQFLLVAILFQLSDYAQVTMNGVLSGYKDVTVAFILSSVAYWVIGLPTGYGLANFTDLGPFGYWYGITIGLTAAAVGYVTRLLYIQKKMKQSITYTSKLIG